jgi:hypothetical protein
MFGAYPILPNRLVYPEIYENCYSTEAQLVKKLKYICSKPFVFRKNLLKEKIFRFKMNINTFKWESLKNEFISLFLKNANNNKK